MSCSGASARGGAAGGSGRAGTGVAQSHQERMEQVGQSIEVFRRQRGLMDGSLHGAHCCGDGECRGFTHLGGDVWICANTGVIWDVWQSVLLSACASGCMRALCGKAHVT